MDVQILTLDDQSTIHYGMSLPNTFPVINFGRLLAQGNISFPTGFINFLSFGGGGTLFGIGVTDAQAFATATQSDARSIYDSTVVVSSGETAEMHVGDKFPIATMLYTGASQLPNATYGPLPADSASGFGHFDQSEAAVARRRRYLDGHTRRISGVGNAYV